jgi:serine/threonine-protein kinase
MADPAAAAMSKGNEPDPLLGRVINDRYKILAFLARGGMGKVYRAEQAALGRICALKVLHPSYSGDHDPAFHKRFSLEASMTSKLRHPNTVTIFDYGCTEDSIYYIAMEYLEGHTLHRAIRQVGHLPEERAAHIARQICRSLREAHTLGVVHRDLKPANVYLLEHGDEQDFVKVLDFGLVKNVAEAEGEELTQAGLFMGSPKYMAPEQVTGGEIGPRTDIYALGVIMYEMMTGKVPFDRPTSLEILMAHAHEEPPPLRKVNPAAKISPGMEEAIVRAMAKSPADRFRSMDEVLAALRRLGPAQPVDPGGHSMVGDRPASGSGPQASSVISVPGGAIASLPAQAPEAEPSRSSVSSSPQSRSSVTSAPQPSPPAEVPVPQATRQTSMLPFFLVVGALVVIGGLALAKLRPSSPAGAAAMPAAVAPATSATAGPATSAATTGSVGAAAPTSVTEVDVSALAPASTSSARPAPIAAPPAVLPRIRGGTPPAVPRPPSVPTPPPVTKPTSECNPSYYYDADGNKHFKPECFGR